jgi:hypothetical protein
MRQLLPLKLELQDEWTNTVLLFAVLFSTYKTLKNKGEGKPRGLVEKRHNVKQGSFKTQQNIPCHTFLETSLKADDEGAF